MSARCSSLDCRLLLRNVAGAHHLSATCEFCNSGTVTTRGNGCFSTRVHLCARCRLSATCWNDVDGRIWSNGVTWTRHTLRAPKSVLNNTCGMRCSVQHYSTCIMQREQLSTNARIIIRSPPRKSYRAMDTAVAGARRTAAVTMP